MDFYGLNIQRHRPSRLLVFGLMLSFSCLPIAGQCSPAVEMSGLKPDTRESVRAIGQALLHAKRSYKGNQSNSALRDSIKQTRQLVNELTQPLKPQQIELVNPNQSAQGAASANARSKLLPTGWHQAQATKIASLRTVTSNLRSQSQKLRSSRGNATATSSFFDSVIGFFTGRDKPVKSSMFILTPVTNSALTYLEQVDAEMEIALALPASQRQQRLRELVDELNIVGQPIRIDDKKIVSPTLSNRTQHRRSL